MGTADIEAAINSSTEKKEDLRKAFEALQSHSSSIISFTLQWKDIENHFSSIEKSIEERFRELKDLDSSSVLVKPATAAPASKTEKKQDMPEVLPRPELKSFCVKMDSKGLRSYIIENRKDIVAIRSELGPALISAPDPVSLVLDSLEGFVPHKKMVEGELQAIRRTCLSILECLHGLNLEITTLDRQRAKGVVVEWKKMITDGKGDNSLVVLGVLHLVAIFGLVESFEVDYILDLIVLVVRRKNIIDLCRSSALEEKMPDLVEKLNNSGKQIDAVKFVLAFNLTDKYPLVSLLKAYIKESKKAAEEVRNKGNNSAQSKNEANSKEISALKAVVKAVEEYKLGSVYSCENIQKRIEQLESQKTEKKRGATAIAAPNSSGKGQKQQQHQQLNKRSRPSAPAHHNHTQLGLVDRAPYVGLAGSYALTAAPSLYNLGNNVGLGEPHTPSKPYLYPESLTSSAYYDRSLGEPHSPSKSYLYSSESLTNSAYYNNRALTSSAYYDSIPTSSAYYDRELANASYSKSGLSASYNPSLYR